MLLLFRGNVSCTNTPQCYVIRKLPVLFLFSPQEPKKKSPPPPTKKKYVYAPHVPTLSVIWHHRLNCDQIFSKFGLGVLYKKLSRKPVRFQPSLSRKPVRFQPSLRLLGRVITTSVPNRNYEFKKKNHNFFF